MEKYWKFSGKLSPEISLNFPEKYKIFLENFSAPQSLNPITVFKSESINSQFSYKKDLQIIRTLNVYALIMKNVG